MRIRINNPERVARIATIATLSFMIGWWFVQVVADVRPFWVDEWRVIYNLKFKTATELWGPLEFMQQFPRAYIEVIKAFTSCFDYSYFSLRLPSYVVGSFTVFFGYRLMSRLYSRGHINRFLFIMILISCSTFTDYYVQVKQYTMDILLSLVAIWQLAELLEINGSKPLRKSRYTLLCTTFVSVPFFSYTYPVVIAPAFIVVLIQSASFVHTHKTGDKRTVILLKWLPLLLCAISVSVFYFADVAQLMHDKDMHKFWGHLLMEGGFNWRSFFINIWMLFAEVGSGFVYWWLMGILGLLSFAWGIYYSIKGLTENKRTTASLLRLYSVLLLLLCIILYGFGKLPLGEPRLNAFTIPAISILFIYFLDSLKEKSRKGYLSTAISMVFYVGLIGNIYTTFFASFTGPEYARKMSIYRSTEAAIQLAQAKKLPIFITPGVAYPYDKTLNLPFKTTVPGDWVLKTFPAYKVADNIPVCSINDTTEASAAIKALPSSVSSVLVGDGKYYRIISIRH